MGHWWHSLDTKAKIAVGILAAIVVAFLYTKFKGGSQPSAAQQGLIGTGDVATGTGIGPSNTVTVGPGTVPNPGMSVDINNTLQTVTSSSGLEYTTLNTGFQSLSHFPDLSMQHGGYYDSSLNEYFTGVPPPGVEGVKGLIYEITDPATWTDPNAPVYVTDPAAKAAPPAPVPKPVQTGPQVSNTALTVSNGNPSPVGGPPPAVPNMATGVALAGRRGVPEPRNPHTPVQKRLYPQA